MKPANSGTPYRVPPEPRRGPAILLAVAVHALLLAFLYFGIRWQSTEPVAVEAEVWDMSVQSAAAPPEPPQPVEPEPEPEPAPKVAEPPPVERPVAPTPPDINLEREKQRKAEQLKKERERELAEKREREELRKKELAEKKEREEQKAKELAKKEEAEKKKKEEQRLAAEKKKAAEAKAQEAKLAKLREAELQRIAGAMGSTGTAAKSTAPKSDSGYIASITAKIKSTTNYLGSTDMPGNPKAVFRVEQLPTGEIISVRMVKSSGVPAFDDAVEKGIIKASPLPKKKDGTVERSLEVNFSMKDLD